MKFRRKRPAHPGSGVQITPMIDVLFNLLFFFAASQVFSQWECEIDIKLPTATTGTIPERLPGEIILNVLKDGRVIVNGRAYDDPALSALLQRIVKIFPGQPVLLRGDRAAQYEQIIRVLDLCRRADIWNISFATASAEGETPATPAGRGAQP